MTHNMNTGSPLLLYLVLPDVGGAVLGVVLQVPLDLPGGNGRLLRPGRHHKVLDDHWPQVRLVKVLHLLLVPAQHHIPHRALAGLLNEVLHVRPRVPIRLAHDLRHVLLRQRVPDLGDSLGHHGPPRLLARQGDVQLLGHPPPGGLIELLRPVGGAHDQNAALGARRVAALDLNEHLRLQPPARLVLAVRLPGAQDRVDLIDEDHGGLEVTRQREERANHLLPLADPLGGQRRGADAEKGCLDVASDGLADQGLARPRRAEEEQALGRRPRALEEVRVQHRPHHHLLDQLLRLALAHDIRPAHPGVLHDVIADALHELGVELGDLLGNLSVGRPLQDHLHHLG
mmetsp:Transcript_11099/g.33904  ORF Transcript_11099/g.33904 Transcript_11099/m.33904 type:complete len:343 (+) Transcript_11099:29-1057(+)